MQNARVKLSPICKVDPLHCSWASIHRFSFSHLKGEVSAATFTHLKHTDEGL